MQTKGNNDFRVLMGGGQTRSHLLQSWFGVAIFTLFAISLITALCGAPETAYAGSSYKIIYKLNGGKQPSGQITKVGKGKTLKTTRLKSPTKKGYAFKGWYSDKSLSKKAKNVKGKSSKSRRTLYAKWSAKKYSITYKLAGGSFAGSHPSKYTFGKGTKLPKVKRAGYSFEGWYADKAKTKLVKSISKTAKGNKTLYAKWKKKTYAIKYHINGGGLPDSYKTSYSVTSEFDLPKPTRPGYVFLGWYMDAALANPIDSITKGMTGTKNLYARWVERILVAHRGFHETAAQNSVDAYVQAAEHGFTYVEADIRFTKDGIPVLSHDATILVYKEEAPADSDATDNPIAGDDKGGTSADGNTVALQCEEDYEGFISEEGGVPGGIVEDIDDGWTSESDGASSGIPLSVQADDAQVESWAIDEHTLAEIQQAQMAEEPSGADGANISTYGELLDVCAKYRLHPTMDLKAGNSYQIFYLMDLAEQYGVFDSARWGASSFAVL